jgi:hypothetical protein
MNYDTWKLSNPIDDGFYTEMVSSCCGAEIVDGDRSDCCDATFIAETDICSDCKEHADIIEMMCSECGEECDEIEDYEYEELQKESYQEMMRDGVKDEY